MCKNHASISDPGNAYLPVLGISGEHHRVLILRDVIILLILSALHILLSLDSLILGEGTVVTLLEGC